MANIRTNTCMCILSLEVIILNINYFNRANKNFSLLTFNLETMIFTLVLLFTNLSTVWTSKIICIHCACYSSLSFNSILPIFKISQPKFSYWLHINIGRLFCFRERFCDRNLLAEKFEMV